MLCKKRWVRCSGSIQENKNFFDYFGIKLFEGVSYFDEIWFCFKFDGLVIVYVRKDKMWCYLFQ